MYNKLQTGFPVVFLDNGIARIFQEGAVPLFFFKLLFNLLDTQSYNVTFGK